MNILLVTPYLPSPPRFGGQRRLHGLGTALAARHDVSVLSMVDPHDDPRDAIRETERWAREVVTVENPRLAARGAGKRMWQLRSLASSRSYEGHVYRSPALEQSLARWVAVGAFDAVCVEFSQTAINRLPARFGHGRPVYCLDEHNVEYDVIRRTADAATGSVRRAYAAADWRKLRREERAALQRFDGCSVTSERDAELVRREAPRARIAVVPNGVDLEYFRRGGDAPAEEPATLLFFGALDYFPNTDGLLFFLRAVLPRIRARVPEVRVRIVGPRPPPRILDWSSEHVQIVGFVDDPRPALERASVIVVPLRIGGGTRLKILESMAMSKAIVSTTLGAEGLSVTPGRELALADSAEAFADETCALLADAARRAAMGAAARALVERSYAWHASAETLASFFATLARAREVA